jgi:CubicO group peptidase (beta-lactamase class C family)
MGGVVDHSMPGKAEVEALAAGNDILILPLDLPGAVCAITEAIDSCILSPGLIENKCRKVLHLKYRLGLWKPQTIDLKNLVADLNPSQALQMNRQLYNSSVTVLRNTNNLLPLQNLENLSIASVVIGEIARNTFQDRLGFYAPIDNYNLPQTSTSVQQAEVLAKLKQYNLVIVGVVNTHPSPLKNFGISDQTICFVDSLQARQDMILDLFSVPYALGLFHFSDRIKGILVSFQDNPLIHDVSAQVIMGGMQATGKLPVSAAPYFKVLDGISTPIPTRLSFALPEAVGIHSADMAAIDSIANDGILKKAYPGCQVLVAKNGVVIYHKAFGYHTYDKSIPVRLTDLYDLASITKVAATTLAVMQLHDEKKIEPEKNLSKYLSYLDDTDKSRMKVREVMAHQAGLQPWIPFYKRTIKHGVMDSAIYSHIYSDRFPDKVADRLYIRKGYRDVIFDSIAHSPLLGSLKYKYSDLDFLLMGDAVERITGMPLNVFVNDTYYKPLGLATMGYHPLWHFKTNEIPPTENDTLFRKQQIDGTVHDPAAAMLGGVAGHAGLFSDANDLAVLMQMLLWQGEYGGRRYISKATVAEFTRVQFPLNNNRRGLGFDKPALEKNQEGPCSSSASPQSFGHSGFTGTFVWADPAEQLVYVFLSNRVYPDAENNKLVKLSIRTNIQDVIYTAIRKGY